MSRVEFFDKKNLVRLVEEYTAHKTIADKLKAEKIFQCIPSLAEKAAEQGRSSVEVMEITENDFMDNDVKSPETVDNLQGIPKELVKLIKENSNLDIAVKTKSRVIFSLVVQW